MEVGEREDGVAVRGEQHGAELQQTAARAEEVDDANCFGAVLRHKQRSPQIARRDLVALRVRRLIPPLDVAAAERVRDVPPIS